MPKRVVWKTVSTFYGVSWFDGKSDKLILLDLDFIRTVARLLNQFHDILLYVFGLSCSLIFFQKNVSKWSEGSSYANPLRSLTKSCSNPVESRLKWFLSRYCLTNEFLNVKMSFARHVSNLFMKNSFPFAFHWFIELNLPYKCGLEYANKMQQNWNVCLFLCMFVLCLFVWFN